MQPKLTVNPSCQSQNPSCISIHVVNHATQLVNHFKLSSNPSCQSSRRTAKQTDRHTVKNWNTCISVPNRNSEKSYWPVFNHKVNSTSKGQSLHLLVQSLRMNIFQQSLVWKILNKGWHTKQWLKNGIHVTCIPQVWKSATKILSKYVWNVYCVMTNHEQDQVTFPYPVNATSFSNGCFSRDLKEIWLAKREVCVLAWGGGMRPGPEDLLVDFLQI